MDLDAIVEGVFGRRRREPLTTQPPVEFSAGTVDIPPEPSIGERVVNAIGDFFEKSRLSRYASVMDEPGTELQERRRRAKEEAERAKTPMMTAPTAPLIEPVGGAGEVIQRFLPQAGYELAATGGRQLQYLADLAGAPETSAYLGREAQRYKRAAERRGLGLSGEPVIQTGTRLDAIIPSPRDISSGLTQTIEQAPAMVGQVMGAMTGSVPTMAASLAPFATQVFGKSYGEALEQGMEPGPAALYALGQSVAETGPEALPSLYFGRALPGLKTLMASPKGPAELAKFLAGGYAAELSNEQLSTLANWAVDYATRDPTATFERLKKDFQDTVKQTLVMVPAMAGVGAGTRLAAERIAEPAVQKGADLRGAAALDDLVDRMFEVDSVSSETLQQVRRGARPTEAEVLPGVPRRMDEGQPPAASRPVSRGAAQVERPGLRHGLPEEGQADPEALRGVRFADGGEAPRGLQQTTHGQVAVSALPPRDAQEEVVLEQGVEYPHERETPLLAQTGRAAPGARPAMPSLSRGQLDLFTEAEPAPAARAQTEAILGAKVNHVRTGAFRVGVERAATREDAAHILAPLRKEAQESFMALVLDANDKPIGIIRHSIGGPAQANVFPGVISSAIASVPGARSVWTAHNHPSGTPYSSTADRQIGGLIEQTLKGSGIAVKGHLIVAPGGKAGAFTRSEDQAPQGFQPTPAVRRGEVPILERRFRRIGRLAPALDSPSTGKRVVPQLLKGQEGVVFLDVQNQPVAVLPISRQELTTLRTGTTERGAAQLMRLISEANASGVVAHFTGPAQDPSIQAAAENVARFGQAMDVRFLDTFVQDAGAVHSLAERGTHPMTGDVNFAQDFPERRFEGEPGFDITPALKERVLGEGVPLFQIPWVGGTRKGYFNEAYKHSQPVKVTLPGGEVFYDAIKGLNEGHALWRARDNWPGATIEPVSLEEVKRTDPEAYREIARLQTYGVAQLSARQVSMLKSLHDPALREDAPPAKVALGGDFGRSMLRPTRGQVVVLERAAGRLVKNGMAPALLREVPMSAVPSRDASPALYNATLHRIGFREQMLNGVMAGEPGADQWLPNAMAHEVSHALDRGRAGFDGAVTRDIVRSFASARSPRFDFTANQAHAIEGEVWGFDEGALSTEGDLMAEAWRAFWNGPEAVRTFLQYPFIAFPLNQGATIKVEVFAQLSALYHTSKALMREHLPVAFKAMEEIYGKTTFAATTQAVQNTLQARPAPGRDTGTQPRLEEPGAARSADVGGPPVGRAGRGVGGTEPAPSAGKRRASLIRDTDSLFVAIAKLGGLNRDEVVSTWGTDPADLRKIGPKGGGVVVRARGGGRSLDGMAEALHELGYLDERDLRELEAKFDQELRGKPVYTPSGYEALARGERPTEEDLDPFEIERSGFNDLPDAEQEAVAALIESLRGRFRGTAAEQRIEEILERADEETRGQPIKAFHAAIIRSLKEVVDAETSRPGTPEERPADQGGDLTPPARPTQGGGPARPARPTGVQGGSQGAFDVADPSKWDEFVRTFQDNKVDLRRLQEAIQKLNPIAEEQDAYLKDELRISRTSDKINRARKQRFLPLVEAIRETGLKLDEVERFLLARHAPEANAQIAKARQAAGLPVTPGLAGMTNAEARQAMDDFRQQGKIAALRQIAAQVDAIIAETRKMYVNGGLESQETIDAWEKTYKFYVPLHREGFGDYAPAVGRGYQIRGAEAKKRIGSRLAVENILANVMAAHEAAIIRAEKNRVDRTLWNLLEANPNPDFWRKGRPTLRQTVDVDTGLPVRVPDMNYKNMTNALVLKIDGQEKVILFNERNERAMELAKALKNLQGSELSWWVQSWSDANRLLANLATSYNPVFWATNFLRDVGTMAFNLQSTELKGQEAKVMRMIPQAMMGVRDELRGNGRSQWAGIYREAKAAGGMTGWMSTFESINDRANDLIATLRKAERSEFDPREVGEKMLQLIKDYNDVVEHATRTAVYKAARDAGLSKDKAASLAKNITVNFNRKGTASSHIGAFYMFFNANVQGTARLVAGAAKSKRLWAYMIFAAGLSTALDVLNRIVLADDDEDGENTYDKVSDEIKSRNLIVMRPGTGGKYVKIPLPYGFNFVAAIGRVMGELATRRDYGPLQAGANLARTAAEAFSPFGQAATPAQIMAPSLLDPVVYALENKDWAGRPIYKETEPGRAPAVPASERGLRTTPLWAKSLAREIAEATEGKVEINPGIVASIVSGYTSGLGTTVSQTFDFAQRAATGQEIPIATIPLVNRLAGEQTEGMRARRFAELKKEALEFQGDLQRLRKAGKTQEAAELEREKPHLRAFLQAYKGEQKTLTGLYKEAERTELEEMSRTERNQATEEWERRRGEVYSRILRRTNEARP